MKSADPVSEFTLLRFSLAMGIFFTVLGVSWGLAIQSAVILFDGIYSGMSILLTALSLLAASSGAWLSNRWSSPSSPW